MEPRFRYSSLLAAQFWQESRCSATAVSPVGARGFGQIMPGTQRDLNRHFGDKPSPFEARRNIRNSVYYLSRRIKTWCRPRSPERTPVECVELGLASYNAGVGNILKAQRVSGNKRTWTEINPSLCRVTGRHCKETQGYVRLIKKHMKDMDLFQYEALVLGRGNVRQWFQSDARSQAPGTFWGWGTCVITAKHVWEEQAYQKPPFVTGEYRCAPGRMDACVIGCSPKNNPVPQAPVRRTRVQVDGVPLGSGRVTTRLATIYEQRSYSASEGYELPTWIGIIDARPDTVAPGTPEAALYYPVAVGMSGGRVSELDGTPIGVLVTMGSPFVFEGKLRQTFDFVPLTQVYAEID